MGVAFDDGALCHDPGSGWIDLQILLTVASVRPVMVAVSCGVHPAPASIVTAVPRRSWSYRSPFGPASLRLPSKPCGRCSSSRPSHRLAQGRWLPGAEPHPTPRGAPWCRGCRAAGPPSCPVETCPVRAGWPPRRRASSIDGPSHQFRPLIRSSLTRRAITRPTSSRSMSTSSRSESLPSSPMAFRAERA